MLSTFQQLFNIILQPIPANNQGNNQLVLANNPNNQVNALAPNNIPVFDNTEGLDSLTPYKEAFPKLFSNSDVYSEISPSSLERIERVLNTYFTPPVVEKMSSYPIEFLSTRHNLDTFGKGLMELKNDHMEHRSEINLLKKLGDTK